MGLIFRSALRFQCQTLLWGLAMQQFIFRSRESAPFRSAAPPIAFSIGAAEQNEGALIQ